MAMMYLADTNIYLEILLKQERSNECKNFLRKNREQVGTSDFSLHSIGAILFRENLEGVYKTFIQDVLNKIKLLSLAKSDSHRVLDTKNEYNLDFDDAYQFAICKSRNLQLYTLDQDFKKVKEPIIRFL